MHDASLVGFCQRTGGLANDVECSRGRKGTYTHHVLRERFALEELHHVIPEAVFGDSVVEHADGVRMRELGGRANLALEAPERAIGARLLLGLENLHRHVALQARVVSDPDDRPCHPRPAGA